MSNPLEKIQEMKALAFEEGMDLLRHIGKQKDPEKTLFLKLHKWILTCNQEQNLRFLILLDKLDELNIEELSDELSQFRKNA